MVRGPGYETIFAHGNHQLKMSQTTMIHCIVDNERREREILYWKVTDDRIKNEIEFYSSRWKLLISVNYDYIIKVQLTAKGKQTGCIKVRRKTKEMHKDDWSYFKRR